MGFLSYTHRWGFIHSIVSLFPLLVTHFAHVVLISVPIQVGFLPLHNIHKGSCLFSTSHQIFQNVIIFDKLLAKHPSLDLSRKIILLFDLKGQCLRIFAVTLYGFTCVHSFKQYIGMHVCMQTTHVHIFIRMYLVKAASTCVCTCVCTVLQIQVQMQMYIRTQKYVYAYCSCIHPTFVFRSCIFQRLLAFKVMLVLCDSLC